MPILYKISRESLPALMPEPGGLDQMYTCEAATHRDRSVSRATRNTDIPEQPTQPPYFFTNDAINVLRWHWVATTCCCDSIDRVSPCSRCACPQGPGTGTPACTVPRTRGWAATSLFWREEQRTHDPPPEQATKSRTLLSKHMSKLSNETPDKTRCKPREAVESL